MTDNQSATKPTLSARAAEEIRALLARRRMSGRELARQMGASHSWVNFRLTGTQPITLDDLERFAGILNVEVSDLLPRGTEGRSVISVGAPREKTTRAYPHLTGQPTPPGHPNRTPHRPATRRTARLR